MSKHADNKTGDGSKASSTDKNSKSEGNSSSHKSSNAVGHYILGKALGEGTFGKVKLGTHILSGEKVAVKVLEKSKIKDKKDVERISREIKILKQLHHPNVV
jgi:serine/threonine protein kinase